VPHLLDVEVVQVLRRQVRDGMLSSMRADEALDDLDDLPLTWHGHGALLRRIWELRHNLTAYDATYVALAEALDATLLTCDGQIASTPGHHARIDVI